jgi:hypothetical protein
MEVEIRSRSGNVDLVPTRDDIDFGETRKREVMRPAWPNLRDWRALTCHPHVFL